jgi:hypothetical protein
MESTGDVDQSIEAPGVVHNARHQSAGGRLIGQIDTPINVNAYRLPCRRRRGEIDGRDGSAIASQCRSNRLTQSAKAAAHRNYSSR